MTTNDLEIYCVTNKAVPFIEGTNIFLAGVGKEKFTKDYILSNTGINIYNKESYYSELTFHYWYWKNRLDVNNNKWIGFCQKRRYWIKSESQNSYINKENIHKLLKDFATATLVDFIKRKMTILLYNKKDTKC